MFIALTLIYKKADIMKTSKQRKIARAIVSNKALKSIDAKRLTDAQSVVAANKYKHERKIWAKIIESFSKVRSF